MMEPTLKSGKWSIQYYDLFKLIGKHQTKNGDSVIIGYAEICLLNIIIQLGNIKEKTNCTMKNSNFAEILNAKERQVQVYLKHLKDLGIISTFEDRLKGTKHMTTKRTIYVKYDRIKELTTCEIAQVVSEPHVDLGINDTCNLVSTTREIADPYRDNNNDIYNDNISTCDLVKEIKISRTGDLAYILDMYSLKEEDVYNIINENKITDVDDFVNLWTEMTKNKNIVFPERRELVNIEEIISNYSEFHNANIFRVRDAFKIADVLCFVSQDWKNKVSAWYGKRGTWQSEIEIKDESEVGLMNKIINNGNQMSANYFRRNHFHK